MNRHTRRAVTKIERQTGGVLVDPRELASLHEMQRLFSAIVKDQGRVRVSKETLNSLAVGDTVKSKLDGDNIMLLFVAAEPPQEGKPG